MRKIFVELLRSRENGGSIGITTTKDGKHDRYLSAIFLSQIHHSTGEHRPECIVFAVRITPRNKAIIRTNKGGCSLAVVEPLPHLTQGGTLLTNTKENNQMKQSNTLTSALNPIRYSQPFSLMGVSYA
ncbi:MULTISPECIES: hypothetical protein [unclassified Lonepinella]|uniref:hypothetical protein n=1 Tax=unclassified Lonepinella TaxID=2642006 RepID=UPI0036D8AA8F